LNPRTTHGNRVNGTQGTDPWIDFGRQGRETGEDTERVSQETMDNDAASVAGAGAADGGGGDDDSLHQDKEKKGPVCLSAQGCVERIKIVP